MVSLALLLLTVSTLATLSNALPTEIRHECERSSPCHIKPDGYPQDEIDSTVLKHLSQLPRRKREIPQPTWVPDNSTTTNGNCAVMKDEKKPLFRQDVSQPEVILQSEWYKQTIAEVKCAKDCDTCGCFSRYVLDNITTKCKTKYMQFELLTYDLQNKPIRSPVKIGIDCVCVLD